MEIKEQIVEPKTFRSSEAIEIVLSSLGLTRENASTYHDYSYANGGFLRLRISGHGIYLQNWYKANKDKRAEDNTIPKLDIGQNLAITFAPNKNECEEMNVEFPMKIKNVTKAKTEMGNNVKPQFTVRHIAYNTWELKGEDVNAIVSALKVCVENGTVYTNPLGDTNKYVAWEDTSNLPPKKITTESNTRKDMKNNKKRLNEYHIDSITLHFIETDCNGRHYYYDDNKGRYVGRGGTPENPAYLYTACGRDWEPDSEVECDNINVLTEGEKSQGDNQGISVESDELPR